MRISDSDGPKEPVADAREAMDRLNDASRVFMEARLLAKSKPLTPEQIGEAQERFRQYIAKHQVTTTQVARECGYSFSVVACWHAGSYTGNNDAVTHAINDWMERHARRAAASRPSDMVKTWIAEDMRTVALQADKRCMMAAIIVPAGAGKTRVLKALTEELRGVYVYCDHSLTPLEFLRQLSINLGRRSEQGSKAAVQRWIIGSLAGTRRIVFLDEAHQLGRSISCVRSIHDQAQVPIIMAGTAEILGFINDRADGRGQFSSRCLRYNALDHVMNAEDPDGNAAGKDLFTIEEIKAFFDTKKIRLDREAMKLCWALACLPNYGTLRFVENTVNTVFDASPDLELVTRAHVVAALKLMVGQEAAYLQRIAQRHIEAAAKVRVA
jgi:DNA transposition AAA+ family ATPase